MRARIFTVHHKDIAYPVETPLFTDFLITDGPHSWAEMCCHHWVWKNLRNQDIDYVGFQHYRRWFCWDGSEGGKVRQEEFGARLPALAYAGKSFVSGWRGMDIVTPKPINQFSPIGSVYCGTHNPAHWWALCEVLQGMGYMDEELNVSRLTPCNMFLMRVELFDQYMHHWWSVVQAVEPRIEIDAVGYQSRAIGFLSERIFTLWLNRQNKARCRTLGLVTTD